MGLFDFFTRNEPGRKVRTFKKDLTTDCGMWGLWDYETYRGIMDYDAWEPLFCEDEDILNQIAKRTFVPVCIFEDGCRSFTLKLNGDLSEREKRLLFAQSEKYLLYTNGKIVLSGLECIGGAVTPEEAIVADLPKGYYEVTVYAIAWDEELGSILEDGTVNPNALSDFVVVLRKKPDTHAVYRQKIETFSQPE